MIKRLRTLYGSILIILLSRTSSSASTQYSLLLSTQIGFQDISFDFFNPDAVISKFNIKLYILISIEPFLVEIDSWVSKAL